MNQLNENYADKVLRFLRQMPPGHRIETAKYIKDPMEFYFTIKDLEKTGKIGTYEFSFDYGLKYFFRPIMKYDLSMTFEENIFYFLMDFPMGKRVEIDRLVHAELDFCKAIWRCRSMYMIDGGDFYYNGEKSYFYSREPFKFNSKLSYCENVLLFLKNEMYYGSMVDVKKVTKDPIMFIDALKTLIANGKIKENECILIEDGAYVKKRGPFLYNFRQGYDDNIFSRLYNMPVGSHSVKEMTKRPSRFIKSVEKLISDGRISSTEYKFAEDGAYLIKGNPV